VRSKLKNCLTGGNVDKTFRAGEQLNIADLMRREVQYTYQDGENVSGGLLPCQQQQQQQQQPAPRPRGLLGCCRSRLQRAVHQGGSGSLEPPGLFVWLHGLALACRGPAGGGCCSKVPCEHPPAGQARQRCWLARRPR
jgi:hypothetical protein